MMQEKSNQKNYQMLNSQCNRVMLNSQCNKVMLSNSLSKTTCGSALTAVHRTLQTSAAAAVHQKKADGKDIYVEIRAKETALDKLTIDDPLVQKLAESAVYK